MTRPLWQSHVLVPSSLAQWLIARRNASEHGEDDCPICLDPVGVAERRAMPCNAKHWLCVGCMRDQVAHGCARVRVSEAKPQLPCHMCRAPAELEALVALCE